MASPSLSPPSLSMRSPLSPPPYLQSKGTFLSPHSSRSLVSPTHTSPNSSGSVPLSPCSTVTDVHVLAKSFQAGTQPDTSLGISLSQQGVRAGIVTDSPQASLTRVTLGGSHPPQIHTPEIDAQNSATNQNVWVDGASDTVPSTPVPPLTTTTRPDDSLGISLSQQTAGTVDSSHTSLTIGTAPQVRAQIESASQNVRNALADAPCDTLPVPPLTSTTRPDDSLGISLSQQTAGTVDSPHTSLTGYQIGTAPQVRAQIESASQNIRNALADGTCDTLPVQALTQPGDPRGGSEQTTGSEDSLYAEWGAQSEQHIIQSPF